MQSLLRLGIGMLVGVVIAAGGFFTFLQAEAQEPTEAEAAGISVMPANMEFIDDANASNPKILYNGQLLETASGDPVTNGVYFVGFRIYDVATGALLFAEGQNVQVVDGLFSVQIGATVPLDVNVFDGRDLSLGIEVNNGGEATPRQPISHVAYAIYSHRAGFAAQAGDAQTLDGASAGDFVRFGNDGIVAFGVVRNDCTREDGRGWSGQRQLVDGRTVCVITVDGESYNLNRFVTVVTPIRNSDCNGPRIAGTNSADNKLIVEIMRPDGSHDDRCKFHFITLEP